jgi:putative two-component system response regulator
VTDDPALLASRVLVVDDERPNVDLICAVLRRAGLTDVTGTTRPAELLELAEAQPADLVVLDLHMPEIDGYGVLERLPAGTPVLVLTADATREAKERALSLGATDFLTKPFDVVEARLRVRNLLSARRTTVELEEAVRRRTAQLDAARVEILDRLALAGEFRDDQTQEHTQRVGATSAWLASLLGLPPADVDLLRQAAPLHDIGKVGVPDAVLLKPGPLDEAEFAVMREHTEIGRRILAGSASPVLRMAEEVAWTHHERWDGGGYPRGLAGWAIPWPGRIVAVADVFDALTHERPYKAAWSRDEALAHLRAGSGTQFCPDVVRAFLEDVG